jgi:ADP-heptose:LPS heptosyltransferase
MEWFNDQSLRPQPHIAVLFYDAIGDFVVVTPLLRGLKEKYPQCVIDYFGGERTRTLEEACRYIDARFSVFGNPSVWGDLPAFVEARRRAAGAYDLAINCDAHPVLGVIAHSLQPTYIVGKCYDLELREIIPHPQTKLHQLHDEFWSAPDLLSRYGDILRTTYIAEIWCRLAFVQTDFYRPEVPQEDPCCDVPEVLIATGGRRPAKLWRWDYWKQLVEWCFSQGYRVGLLGDNVRRQSALYHVGGGEQWLLEQTPLIDLRGKFTLPQVAGALARARACVSVDNGIMHLCYAVGTPTVALFGASPWRVWAPPVPHLHVMLPDEPCDLCFQNRFRNANCLLPVHQCMQSIRPERVIQRLQTVLQAGSGCS